MALLDKVPSQKACRVPCELTDAPVTTHPRMKIKIHVKERNIPYNTANQRCLQHVNRHPNPPVATATRPDDSRRPNEAFLNFARLMSEGSADKVLTLKNESPKANLIARADITMPMKNTSAERMVRASAGYFLDVKQTHILFYFIR